MIRCAEQTTRVSKQSALVIEALKHLTPKHYSRLVHNEPELQFQGPKWIGTPNKKVAREEEVVLANARDRLVRKAEVAVGRTGRNVKRVGRNGRM